MGQGSGNLTAFEVSKTVCMAELHFELLVLRSSSSIKQITEVAASCHHAHDNLERLTVTHAQRDNAWHLNSTGAMPNRFTFTTMPSTLNSDTPAHPAQALQ